MQSVLVSAASVLLTVFSTLVAAETSRPIRPAATTASVAPAPVVAAPSAPQAAPAPPIVAAVSPVAPAAASNVRVLLVPESETTVSSAIAARIVRLNASLGQTFKAGDVLVSFDCEEAKARLEMSKAELAGAVEQHEAKVKMHGLNQASDVEVALAASAANKAKGQMGLNRAQVSQCQVYAPWSGRIARLHAKNYMTVTPGQPLLDLVKAGPLKLKLNMPSKLLSRMKVGSEFKIVVDETQKTYPASIVAINSRVDTVSQTVEIESLLTGSYPELQPGMSGVAEFSR